MNQIFNIGFKPLFLCTGISALLLIGVWTAYLNGLWPAFSPRVNPVFWHGHEMLFGFVGSAIGGFLLTAVASWTKRPPVQGPLLALIVFAWLAGRWVMAVDVALPFFLIVAIDAAYWLFLTTIVGREVILSRNHRNLPVVLILLGFFSLTIVFHFYPMEALRGGVALVCILIMLIAGRIIPAFTTNWLKLNQGLQTPTPTGFNRFDTMVVLFTLPTLVVWSITPYEPLLGWMLLLVSLLHTIRLSRWQGHRTFSEPLVFSLHAGYAWLPIGFALLGLTALNGRLPVPAGIHALGIGAIAAMILAVSTRAAKGHSGRALASDPLLSLCFILIHLAAVLRISTNFFPSLLLGASIIWLISFGIFMFLLIQIIFLPPDLEES